MQPKMDDQVVIEAEDGFILIIKTNKASFNLLMSNYSNIVIKYSMYHKFNIDYSIRVIILNFINYIASHIKSNLKFTEFIEICRNYEINRDYFINEEAYHEFCQDFKTYVNENINLLKDLIC